MDDGERTSASYSGKEERQKVGYVLVAGRSCNATGGGSGGGGGGGRIVGCRARNPPD